MDNTIELYRKKINRIPETIIDQLEKGLQKKLDICGIFYKSFSRIKKPEAVYEKIKSHNDPKYKLKDLFGIRIVVYFYEDISICEKIVSMYFNVIRRRKDVNLPDSFKARRINYVCTLPDDSINMLMDDSLWEMGIDKCFEIQIRTVLSEGWHEIEHDFRYKKQDDWESIPDLERRLSGILATLENCDWLFSTLMQKAAMDHFNNKEWIPMLKSIFLLRITDDDEMDDIISCFNDNPEVSKQFLHLNRGEFIINLVKAETRIPLKLRNLVFLENIWFIHDEHIESITPPLLEEKSRLSHHTV